MFFLVSVKTIENKMLTPCNLDIVISISSSMSSSLCDISNLS